MHKFNINAIILYCLKKTIIQASERTNPIFNLYSIRFYYYRIVPNLIPAKVVIILVKLAIMRLTIAYFWGLVNFGTIRYIKYLSNPKAGIVASSILSKFIIS